MKINLSHNGFLELCSLNSAERNSDINVKVSFRSEFTQGMAEAWLCRKEVEAFIEGLKTIDSRLKGEAYLSSLSPEELLLEIKPVDFLGHFILTIKTGRRYLVHSESVLACSNSAFPLDSQSVSRVCQSLIEFFTGS